MTKNSIDTIAEGLATRSSASLTLGIMRRLVSDIVLVTDEEILAAMRLILESTHNLPEPAGAASTAAAWKLRDQLAGQTVVAILSGGNCDLNLLTRTTSVRLPPDVDEDSTPNPPSRPARARPTSLLFNVRLSEQNGLGLAWLELNLLLGERIGSVQCRPIPNDLDRLG